MFYIQVQMYSVVHFCHTHVYLTYYTDLTKQTQMLAIYKSYAMYKYKYRYLLLFHLAKLSIVMLFSLFATNCAVN